MFRNQDPGQPFPPVILWAVRGLALLAVGLATYLTFVSFDHAPLLGCSGGDTLDCDAVFNTGWSRIIGIPVALFGLLTYVAILLATFGVNSYQESTQKPFLFLLVLFSTLAAGSAIWFLGLQFAIIGKFCIFCCIVHTCGLLIAGLVYLPLIQAAAGRQEPVQSLTSAGGRGLVPASAAVSQYRVVTLGSLAVPFLLGGCGLAALIATQVFLPTDTQMIAKISDLGEEISMDEPSDIAGTGVAGADTSDRAKYTANRIPTTPPDISEPIEPATVTEGLGDPDEESAEEESLAANLPAFTFGRERVVSMMGGGLTFNLYKQAYIGDPEAEHVVLELFDYTCPHCRKLHEYLKYAERYFNNQIVVVTMPVPMELKCNKLFKRARPHNHGACKMAALALEISRLDPNKFQEYHKWLMDSGEERARPLDKAIIKAFRLLPNAKTLRNIDAQEEINDRIQKHIRLFDAITKRFKGEKSPGLPILIVKDEMMSGLSGYDDKDDFCRKLEERLGLTSVVP